MSDFELSEYKNFRTGYNFKQVRRMLSIEQKRKYENGVYMFVTRATVLGRWHEIKQQMYAHEETLHAEICK